MTVLDASVVVAGLFDSGREGDWARETLVRNDAVAPHLMPAEVTQIARRLVHAGELGADAAALALDDLHDLAVPLVPFDPVASRVWALRHNLTAYDAWYVAIAEALDAPLATLDRRLVTASGPACRFLTPGRT